MTDAPTIAAWGGASRFADLDGPVHYVDFGGEPTGPTLVLVHGLGGSHLNWSLLAPLLVGSTRVLAVDLLGFGLSHPQGRSTTVQANVRMLDRFVREIAGGPVVLVGNSMGGLTSILTARRHPETASGLILIDPALPPAGGARPEFAVLAAFAGFALPIVGRVALARGRRRLTPRQQVERLLRLCCVDPARIPADLVAASVALAEQRAKVSGLDAAFLAAARSLLALNARRSRMWATIDGLNIPVLHLHGEQDRLVPVESARFAAQRHPEWTAEVFSDVGHVPQLEVPMMTAARILTWLQGAGATAARRACRSGQVGGTAYPEGDTHR